MSKDIIEKVLNMGENGDDFGDEHFEETRVRRLKEDKKTLYEWTNSGNNSFRVAPKTFPKLEAGFYDIRKPYYDKPPDFRKNTIENDTLISFKDSKMNKVLDEIKRFWTLQEEFKKNGFLHRRGILFYGDQGCGKSSIIKLMIQHLISEGGIVINGNWEPPVIIEALAFLRKAEPERSVICLFEDLDSIIGKYGESELLALLDGESSINHVLNIATTNFPENLNDRIKSRPRRFDRIIRIDHPEDNIRREFFNKKLNVEEVELNKIVRKTKGFSFAAMTELVISIQCFQIDFEKAYEILDNQLNFNDTSENYKCNPAGFNCDIKKGEE